MGLEILFFGVVRQPVAQKMFHRWREEWIPLNISKFWTHAVCHAVRQETETEKRMASSTGQQSKAKPRIHHELL